MCHSWTPALLPVLPPLNMHAPAPPLLSVQLGNCSPVASGPHSGRSGSLIAPAASGNYRTRLTAGLARFPFNKRQGGKCGVVSFGAKRPCLVN